MTKFENLHPIFKAYVFTVITFATIHLTISNLYAMFNGAWDELNYFHVLAIDVLWPALGHGMFNFWLSQVLCWMVLLFWVSFFWRKRKAGTAE
jgi:hypothetical protein